MGDYQATYTRSIDGPRGVLGRRRDGDRSGARPPTRVLDDSRPPFYRWFPDGELNTCENALDRHVAAGHGDRTALVYDSPVTGSKRTYTYAELLAEVATFAGALASLGVAKGDRVVIYLPMVPEAVVAMLACARLGAVHSVVFGGFAASELAARVEDARPRVLVTASCGIEVARVIEYKPLVDRALGLSSHQPDHVVVLQRPQAVAAMTAPRDLDWHELAAAAEPAECVTVAATDPLYILYTSGTTAKPKGVVRDNGGHAVALAWSMANIYDVGPGDVWWTASDVGWVVGHSYIVYAPLLVGATTVLYEGKPVGTPDAGAFWRVVSEYARAGDVHGADRVPGGQEGGPDRPAALGVRRLEPADPVPRRRAARPGHLAVGDRPPRRPGDRPLVADRDRLADRGQPARARADGDQAGLADGSGAGVRRAGARPVRRRGAARHRGRDLHQAAAAARGPCRRCGATTSVSSRPTSSAFDGYYLTGDGGYVDEDGYLFVMGRTDDVINVAGHRLSTGSMEAVIAGHPAVAECCVIGVHDELKGQVPRGLVVLKAGVDVDPDALRAELVQRVRDEIGAVASFRQVDVVAGLPKTRSGKILRRSLRAIADGVDEPVPSTIEDPAVLDALRPVLQT